MISTEDRVFFSNPGIDPAPILRSIIVDLKNGQYTQGGSTITQQLVRNVLPITYRKTFAHKLIEAMDVIGVTHDLSKQQIFILYVNDVYYGQGSYRLYSY